MALTPTKLTFTKINTVYSLIMVTWESVVLQQQVKTIFKYHRSQTMALEEKNTNAEILINSKKWNKKLDYDV